MSNQITMNFVSYEELLDYVDDREQIVEYEYIEDNLIQAVISIPEPKIEEKVVVEVDEPKNHALFYMNGNQAMYFERIEKRTTICTPIVQKAKCFSKADAEKKQYYMNINSQKQWYLAKVS